MHRGGVYGGGGGVSPIVDECCPNVVLALFWFGSCASVRLPAQKPVRGRALRWCAVPLGRQSYPHRFELPREAIWILFPFLSFLDPSAGPVHATQRGPHATRGNSGPPAPAVAVPDTTFPEAVCPEQARNGYGDNQYTSVTGL